MITLDQLSGFSKYFLDFGLPFTYIVLIVAILSVVVFAVIQFANACIADMKKALTILASIVGVIGLYLICYFLLATNESVIINEETFSAGTMRFVETNLFMTYITLFIALAAIGYSLVSQSIK